MEINVIGVVIADSIWLSLEHHLSSQYRLVYLWRLIQTVSYQIHTKTAAPKIHWLMTQTGTQTLLLPMHKLKSYDTFHLSKLSCKSFWTCVYNLLLWHDSRQECIDKEHLRPSVKWLVKNLLERYVWLQLSCLVSSYKTFTSCYEEVIELIVTNPQGDERRMTNKFENQGSWTCKASETSKVRHMLEMSERWVYRQLQIQLYLHECLINVAKAFCLIRRLLDNITTWEDGLNIYP